MQALKLALTALIIGLVPNPLHAGDKAYIEIEIDGEMLGKWMEFCEHSEYNPDGKEVYWKKAGFDGTVTECWYEYDRNGNCIHKKSSNGDEWWYEYDRNGNCIHKKSSGGDETWHKYDRNGKRIHTKYSDGSKRWYEYDTYGNMTRKIRKSEDGKIDITVYILEYYTDSTTVKTKSEYRYEQ